MRVKVLILLTAVFTVVADDSDEDSSERESHENSFRSPHHTFSTHPSRSSYESYHSPKAKYYSKMPKDHSTKPKYQFGYAVKDTFRNNYGHRESRDGDFTQGFYYNHLPDGRLQKVTYTVSGESGFLAEVSYEGQARYDSRPFKSRMNHRSPIYIYESNEFSGSGESGEFRFGSGSREIEGFSSSSCSFESGSGSDESGEFKRPGFNAWLNNLIDPRFNSGTSRFSGPGLSAGFAGSNVGSGSSPLSGQVLSVGFSGSTFGSGSYQFSQPRLSVGFGGSGRFNVGSGSPEISVGVGGSIYGSSSGKFGFGFSSDSSELRLGLDESLEFSLGSHKLGSDSGSNEVRQRGSNLIFTPGLFESRNDPLKGVSHRLNSTNGSPPPPTVRYDPSKSSYSSPPLPFRYGAPSPPLKSSYGPPPSSYL